MWTWPVCPRMRTIGWFSCWRTRTFGFHKTRNVCWPEEPKDTATYKHFFLPSFFFNDQNANRLLGSSAREGANWRDLHLRRWQSVGDICIEWLGWSSHPTLDPASSVPQLPEQSTSRSCSSTITVCHWWWWWWWWQYWRLGKLRFSWWWGFTWS